MVIRRRRLDDDDSPSCCAINGKDLIFCGDVGPKLSVFLWENLLRAGTRLDEDTAKAKEGRRLFLNSLGGCVYTMASIVDLMEEVENITTVATGACMSAAVPIIAAGTPGQRYATWRTRFLLHPSWEEFDGRRLEIEDLQAESDEMKEAERVYAHVMARYTDHTYSWWLKRGAVHKPYYFGPEDALKFGIIDHIIQDKGGR